MSKITGQTAWLLRRLRAFKVQADLDRLFLYYTLTGSAFGMFDLLPTSGARLIAYFSEHSVSVELRIAKL